MPKISSISFPYRIFNRFIWESRNFNNVLVPKSAVVEKEFDYSVCKEFPEQTVKIETCGKLYEEWRKNKRFRRLPTGDLTFNVRYVDTHFNETKKVKDRLPIVLTMHGAPGSHEDFKLLTFYLSQRELRVISPCFPDFTVCPPGVFRHSCEEKAQYIKDFLEAIDVLHVDLLVCHSSSVYPGLKLCVDNSKPSISSLALLNPGAYSVYMSSTQFYKFMKFMAWLSTYPAGLEFLKVAAPPLLRMAQVPVNLDNFLDPLLSSNTMVYADIPKARTHLTELSVRQFPIFLAFSEDDKLIQKELSYRIAYRLFAQDDDIAYVSADGRIIKQGRIVRNVKAMAFETGSHYVFSKYPQIINEAIYTFLEKLIL